MRRLLSLISPRSAAQSWSSALSSLPWLAAFCCQKSSQTAAGTRVSEACAADTSYRNARLCCVCRWIPFWWEKHSAKVASVRRLASSFLHWSALVVVRLYRVGKLRCVVAMEFWCRADRTSSVSCNAGATWSLSVKHRFSSRWLPQKSRMPRSNSQKDPPLNRNSYDTQDFVHDLMSASQASAEGKRID